VRLHCSHVVCLSCCRGKVLLEGLITIRNFLFSAVELKAYHLPASYVQPVRHWQGFELYHAYFYFDTEDVKDSTSASLPSQQAALAFWLGAYIASLRCCDCEWKWKCGVAFA
jgi:hypothetical protein